MAASLYLVSTPMTKRPPRQSPGKANPLTLRRLGRYIPLLLWIAFIFFASTGKFSSDHTSQFVRPLLLWLFPEISEGKLAGVHFLIRKVSHLAEYAILALLARRAFVTSSHALLQRRWFQLTLMLVVVCSLLDEFHQSYMPARSSSILDSLIDVIGGLTVLLLFRSHDRRLERSARL